MRNNHFADAAGADAKAQTFSPRQQRLPEPDGELLHLHARPLGGEKMPQLVPEDHGPESKNQEQNAGKLIEKRLKKFRHQVVAFTSVCQSGRATNDTNGHE